jgi:hypothetical protein
LFSIGGRRGVGYQSTVCHCISEIDDLTKERNIVSLNLRCLIGNKKVMGKKGKANKKCIIATYCVPIGKLTGSLDEEPVNFPMA